MNAYPTSGNVPARTDTALSPWKVLCLSLIWAFVCAGEVWAQTTTWVSKDSDGYEGNGAWNYNPSISADGRYVAFESDSDNLVPSDNNGYTDIFVHDLETGETTRVSVDPEGNDGNGWSNCPCAISADGRFVAFQSGASNLVPGGIFLDNVFVHDRDTGENIQISVNPDGTQPNVTSEDPSISADGRYVAFQSSADTLVPEDTNETPDIFVHDRGTGEITRISVDSEGDEADSASGQPFISGNGRYVAFTSQASNLVPEEIIWYSDIFVHDRETGETTKVSVDSGGNEARGESSQPSISSDGRYVAFLSWASNLVPGDTNFTYDVFVHDRETAETTRVSVDSEGNQAYDLSSDPSLSAEGRYVAFRSLANNLVPEDTNSKHDIFVHDRGTGETIRVSVDSDGNQANDVSARPTISADGRNVAFDSKATNLVTEDTYSNYWGFETFVHGPLAADPAPDLKANGEDGILYAKPWEAVEITAALDAAGQVGQPAEWWIGAIYNNAVYPIYVGTRPIVDLPPTTIWNNPLPPGVLVFFFVLDDTLDGVLEVAWLDYAVVVVTSADPADVDVSGAVDELIGNWGKKGP